MRKKADGLKEESIAKELDLDEKIVRYILEEDTI